MVLWPQQLPRARPKPLLGQGPAREIEAGTPVNRELVKLKDGHGHGGGLWTG